MILFMPLLGIHKKRKIDKPNTIEIDYVYSCEEKATVGMFSLNRFLEVYVKKEMNIPLLSFTIIQVKP